MPRNRSSQRPRATPTRASTRTSVRTSFADFVTRKSSSQPSIPPGLPGEDLAHLDYAEELTLKNDALAAFCQQARIGVSPEPLIASPRPRAYRTTSKRRVAVAGGRAHLFLGDRKLRRGAPVFAESPLEPAEHTQIFAFLQARLSEPAFRVVAEHLGWLVVRGSYTERAVIFNVDTLFGPLVRKLKLLGKQLAAFEPSVAAAFVYVDETESDYYLEARRPTRTVDFKKLFGPEALRISYGDLRLAYHPTSFSQINESIVTRMLESATRLLGPRAGDRLLDLYCGYGLFSHAMAAAVAEVIGVDAAEPSVDAARANSRRLGHRSARFSAKRITAGAIERLPPPRPDEIVILDPPRNGTEPGVIEAIAARRPRRVLHVFCSVDEIPDALDQWKRGGYRPERMVALDMFPGTPHVEVLVALGRPGS